MSKTTKGANMVNNYYFYNGEKVVPTEYRTFSNSSGAYETMTSLSDRAEKAEAQVAQMKVDLSNGYDNEIQWRKRAEEAKRLAASLQEENYELSNAHARAYHAEEKQRVAELMVNRLLEAWEQLFDGRIKTLRAAQYAKWRSLADEWNEQG